MHKHYPSKFQSKCHVGLLYLRLDLIPGVYEGGIAFDYRLYSGFQFLQGVVPRIPCQFFHNLLPIDGQRAIGVVMGALMGRQLHTLPSIALEKKAHLARAEHFCGGKAAGSQVAKIGNHIQRTGGEAGIVAAVALHGTVIGYIDIKSKYK